MLFWEAVVSFQRPPLSVCLSQTSALKPIYHLCWLYPLVSSHSTCQLHCPIQKQSKPYANLFL